MIAVTEFERSDETLIVVTNFERSDEPVIALNDITYRRAIDRSHSLMSFK